MSTVWEIYVKVNVPLLHPKADPDAHVDNTVRRLDPRESSRDIDTEPPLPQCPLGTIYSALSTQIHAPRV